MHSLREISASNALRLLLARGSVAALDVRSDGEFRQGQIPGFRNLPILNDEERHQVGLCYKRHGQAAAIELGHRLLVGEKERRIEGWKSFLKGAESPMVCCWRGGLRSRTTAEWLAEAGIQTPTIQGGYKALRQELLAATEKVPELLVIAGSTGSNKSRLLREFPRVSLDLERLACHRGSAFGGFLDQAQPAQATFENAVGLRLMELSADRLLVEDESLLIGQVHLPLAIRDKLGQSPLVLVRMNAEERAKNIYTEYVAGALDSGIAVSRLEERYQQNLQCIEKKLGGALARQLSAKVRAAFAAGDADQHREWILDLLLHYYDKAYAYSLERAGRPIAFEGEWEECNQWIRKKFA